MKGEQGLRAMIYLRLRCQGQYITPRMFSLFVYPSGYLSQSYRVHRLMLPKGVGTINGAFSPRDLLHGRQGETAEKCTTDASQEGMFHAVFGGSGD